MQASLTTVSKQFTGDASHEEIKAAIAGHYMQIRHMPAEARAGALLAEITSIAKQYGARQEIDDDTIAEAARFVSSSFPWLGVREIRTAFRWHASGRIETQAGEMYGGMFTVRALGAILAQYNDLRKKIVARHLELVAQAEAERVEAEQKAEKRRAFEKNLIESVGRAKAQKLPWQDIPAAWHDWLLARGKLEYTADEKRKAWDDSAALAEQERTEEAATLDSIRLSSLMKKDLGPRRVVIAKKLLVHRKLITP